VAADSPERAARTKEFQRVNDAYYTLSDPTRRKEYDEARAFHGFGNSAGEEDTSDGTSQQKSSFPWSAFGFGPKSTNTQNEEQFANEQFGSVFEEMMQEEGLGEETPENPGLTTPTKRFWSILGSISGGTIGFIVANIPGAMAGAVAGNRLGAVRDARGKSVYEVFQELPQSDKARFLSELATKIFATAISG
jgi:curved DNA-binding protein CbpA